MTDQQPEQTRSDEPARPRGPRPAAEQVGAAGQELPDGAVSERAGETPAHPDAERMEAALRAAGPLVKLSDPAEQARQSATEDGPGTSLS